MHLKTIEKQTNTKLIIILFLTAFIARVSAVILVTQFKFKMNLFAPDTTVYIRRAIDLINNGWGEVVVWYKSGYVTSFYSVILAFLLKYIVGVKYDVKELIFYHGIMNAVIGGLTCIFIYYSTILASSKNKSISFFCAAMIAVYPEFLLWNTYLLKETLNIFFMSAGIFSIYIMLNQKKFLNLLLSLTLLFIVFFINFTFRNVNGSLLIATFLILVIIAVFGWFKNRYSSIKFKKTLYISIIIIILIPTAFIFYNLIGLELNFSTFYHYNSPGGPFETWGYYEGADREGERISVWKYLGLEKEQFRDFSKAKQETIYLFAFGKYIVTSPIEFLTHTTQKFINMWRPVWKNSSAKTHLMMGVPYLIVMFFLIIYFFRRKSYEFEINALPYIALTFSGIVMHLIFAGQIRFRLPVMIGILPLASIGMYELAILFYNKRLSHRKQPSVQEVV